MRIGLLSGEYPPQEGGLGAYTHVLGRTLADHGHDLFVLAGPGAREANSRMRLESVPNWGINHWRKVEEWANRCRLDVINLQYQTAAYGMSPWVHFLPDRVRSSPIVVTFHDLRFPYLFPKAGPLRPWIVRHLARSAKGVIATNPEDYAKLASLPRAVLIPIGSNISTASINTASRPALSPNQPHIVYFGLINRTKGLDTLLDALTQLRLEGSNADLTIVGSAGASDPSNQVYEAEFRSKVVQRGLSQSVHFTGFLPDEDVAALLRAADVVALPFLDGASTRRGSLMAALAAGCAIVTTTPDYPTPGFVDGESMRLVAPGDPISLAAALLDVLEDSRLYRRLSQGALALSRQFLWPTIATSVATFMSQVISETRAS